MTDLDHESTTAIEVYEFSDDDNDNDGETADNDDEDDVVEIELGDDDDSQEDADDLDSPLGQSPVKLRTLVKKTRVRRQYSSDSLELESE